MNWTALRCSLLGEKNRSILPPRVKLPVLPLAVMKFSKKAEEPDVTPRELGKIIESDSGLTCELLRYVNSSARGMRHKASSAQQAISLLGVRESKLYLLTAAVRRSMRGGDWKLINIRDFWATNLERALLAQEVARLLGADTETAFSAAMLQDFLLPSLTNGLLPKYLKFLNERDQQPVSLTSFEKKAHGWDHTEAAANVMLRWEFPDELICCVRLHHHGVKLLNDPRLGRTAVAAVAVSALLPDALRQVPDGFQRLFELDAKWPGFDLMQIARIVHNEFQNRCPGTTNAFSLLRRCRSQTSVSK